MAAERLTVNGPPRGAWPGGPGLSTERPVSSTLDCFLTIILDVPCGIYARILFVLGLVGRLAELADVRHDDVGLELEEEHLPERIRRPRPRDKGEN